VRDNVFFNLALIVLYYGIELLMKPWSLVFLWRVLLSLALFALIYRHAWEILKVTLICGFDFKFCKIYFSRDKLNDPQSRLYESGQSTTSLGKSTFNECFNEEKNCIPHQEIKPEKAFKQFHLETILLANDVETNPGPACMRLMQNFLAGDKEYRCRNQAKLFRALKKLHTETREGKIETSMFTEANLIILYNILDAAINEKYPEKEIQEIEQLSNHWYTEIRKEELRLRYERKNNLNICSSTKGIDKEDENGIIDIKQEDKGMSKHRKTTKIEKRLKMRRFSPKQNEPRGDWIPSRPGIAMPVKENNQSK